MKTIAYISAMITLVIAAAPAEAGKRRDRDDGRRCITVEQTGNAKARLTESWAQSAALANAWKLVRSDVVKQAGGEMRLVDTVLERCDPVNVSTLRQSCRVKARFCN